MVGLVGTQWKLDVFLSFCFVYDLRHLLVVFGGVAGLEESKELDKTIEVSDFHLAQSKSLHLAIRSLTEISILVCYTCCELTAFENDSRL